MPGVDEEIVETVNAYVLTERKALHLRATRTFKDPVGTERKAGEEWLVTMKDAPTHIPGVYEKVVGEVSAVVGWAGERQTICLARLLTLFFVCRCPSPL